MPDSKKIDVSTYDGYKGGEKPRKVIMSGREYRITDILKTSRVRRADEQGDEEHFRVNLKGYGEAEIVYHHSWDGWTLEEKPADRPLSEVFLKSKS